MPRDDVDDAGREEDLQFQLDDPSSYLPEGSSFTRAFSRAVCVSFTSEHEKAAPLGSLESKVKQLVADFGSLDTADDAGMLVPLAAHLRAHGLEAVVTAPKKPNPASPLSTRSINAPFLVITRPSVGDREDEAGDQQDKETPEVVVVDAALRQHLALAPATPAYQRAMTAAVPEVFVGTRSRLARLVKSLNPSIAANFSIHGMEQPPWRRTSALLHRWSGVEEQELLLRLQWEGQQQGQDLVQQEQQQLQLPVFDEDGDVAWPMGMPAVVGPAPIVSVVPIVGFEVGSLTVGGEPWYGTQPGTFVGSLQRRSSSAGSDDASADSEECIAGLSPVSVFRASPVKAAVPAKIVVGGF